MLVNAAIPTLSHMRCRYNQQAPAVQLKLNRNNEKRRCVGSNPACPAQRMCRYPSANLHRDELQQNQPETTTIYRHPPTIQAWPRPTTLPCHWRCLPPISTTDTTLVERLRGSSGSYSSLQATQTEDAGGNSAVHLPYKRASQPSSPCSFFRSWGGMGALVSASSAAA